MPSTQAYSHHPVAKPPHPQQALQHPCMHPQPCQLRHKHLPLHHQLHPCMPLHPYTCPPQQQTRPHRSHSRRPVLHLLHLLLLPPLWPCALQVPSHLPPPPALPRMESRLMHTPLPRMESKLLHKPLPRMGSRLMHTQLPRMWLGAMCSLPLLRLRDRQQQQAQHRPAALHQLLPPSRHHTVQHLVLLLAVGVLHPVGVALWCLTCPARRPARPTSPPCCKVRSAATSTAAAAARVAVALPPSHTSHSHRRLLAMLVQLVLLILVPPQPALLHLSSLCLVAPLLLLLPTA